MSLLNDTLLSIKCADQAIITETQKYLDNLLKPPGSLGKLEDIAKKLSGISGKIKNLVSKKAIMVMCSDNGVFEENYSKFPQEVSMLVAETMLKGICGVGVLARHAKAELFVVDLGLKDDVKTQGIINRKIRKSTSNIVKGPAMSRVDAVKAIEIGIEETFKAIDNGYDLFATGEVGICNTTTSSAVLFALTGESPDILVGRGAGQDDDGLKIKRNIVTKSVELNKPDKSDPIDVLAKVGGFDIAGMVGTFLAAASRRKPVLIDGFISGTAAVIAYKLNPLVKDFMIASHGTDEPGGKVINKILGLEPMLNMNMRLGEGTGCALAFNLIEAACAMINNMGTFSDIGM